MEKHITTYFDEHIAASKAAVAALNADNRADEAVFEKIRMNMYSIFRSVYIAGAEVCGNDQKKRVEFLFQRIESILSDWQTAYDNACRHDNVERMHIEQLKLETVAEIRKTVLEWRENA